MRFFGRPASVILEDGVLIFESDYSSALVGELKFRIPSSDRRFDWKRKVWLVKPKHGDVLRELTAKHLGEHVNLPEIVRQRPKTETRILEVRYIGACKDRGDGEPTAFGWLKDEWSAIFPESVLRDWFCAQQVPGEAPTLYAKLGVDRDVGQVQIKAAYRRLALQWHPDRCLEPDAHEQFIAIQHAYDVLANERTRAKYNAGLLLQASIPDRLSQSAYSSTYRPPLRCGFIMAEGTEALARFEVSRILAWEDVVDSQGRTLITSWPKGADHFEERWT